MLPAIARALTLVDDEDRLAERLVETLRDREILLVLDNLEHLPGAAPELAALAAACPEVTLLFTSRRPLRLPGPCA